MSGATYAPGVIAMVTVRESTVESLRGKRGIAYCEGFESWLFAHDSSALTLHQSNLSDITPLACIKSSGEDATAAPGVCQDCGHANPVWYAPHALWNLVMGGPEATDDPGGIICPPCFIVRAEAVGAGTVWRLDSAERPTDDLKGAYRERDAARAQRDTAKATIARVRKLAEHNPHLVDAGVILAIIDGEETP